MSSPTPIASKPEQTEKIAQCASCGSNLSGPYCSQCGEQVIDHHALTMKHFFSHGVMHELTHLDGKIFRTFRLLLFRPGFLSAEYFAGRRRMYVNPIRLLLTAALIFALTVRGAVSVSVGPLRLNLVPPGTPSGTTIQRTIDRLDVLGILSWVAHWRAQTRDLASEAAAEKFHHELKTYGSALSFCNVGLLALFLCIVYRRRRPLFLEHLVFSFHLAAFVLLFSILLSWSFELIFLLTRIRISAGVVFLMLALIAFVESLYVYRALLRFYRPETVGTLSPWGWTAWMTRGAVVLIFFVNSVFITITYAAGAAIALLQT